jgi:hypothetical protein
MAISKKSTMTKNGLADLTTSPDKAFYMCNGEMVSRLGDLPNKLQSIDDGTFSYHVNGDRNDFASWIDGVFQNSALAKKVAKAKTKSEMIKALNSSFSS